MLIYLTSLGAGILAALSPCVLPILPIMAGSSMSENKRGPVFLALGLIFSFVLMGLAFSSMTSLLGLSEEVIRNGSAAMLVFFGLILFVPLLKTKMNELLQPIASYAFGKSSLIKGNSVASQVGIGALLGAAWGPCVGPTLGIALGLAASKGGVAQAAAMMAIFGIGLSLPFLGFAYGFRKILSSRKTHLISWNRYSTRILGASLALVGIFMLAGLDKPVEAYAVSILPTWFLGVSSYL
ncbi:MAG: cytochrome c biogenesis protein CcdA [Bdellovibrionaceae bacterium]|nr:cytochrome c biogenesis protein CcdA [Pseudobdellovibrionaceae bacterium]